MSTSKKGELQNSECVLQIMWLEQGSQAFDAHNALQNINTSTNFQRGLIQYTTLKLILGTNAKFNQLVAEILCGPPLKVMQIDIIGFQFAMKLSP